LRLYIGVPFYGGADAEFVSSLIKLRLALHIADYDVECNMHTGCSILPKARNEIVMQFMSSGFDKLLFLDNDIVFNAVDVFKLINSTHDICALNYRKKNDKIEYTGTLTGNEKEGWLQAVSVGAGCMLISRKAIETMQQDNPDTRYVTDNGEIAFSLFDFLNYDGKYWGEDTTFCRRAIESGFDISVLKDAKTGHIGRKLYS
jgi:hypothetical protein